MSVPCHSFNETMNLDQVGKEPPAIASSAVGINRRFLHPAMPLASFKMPSVHDKNIHNIKSLC